MTGSVQILTISIPLTPSNVTEWGSTAVDTNDLKVAIGHGFFGFTQGSMTFHRDETGKLRSIERETVVKIGNEKRVDKRIFYLSP